MAMSAAKMSGAIHGTCGGPTLVHAKPNRPIGSSGAATSASHLAQPEPKRGAGRCSLKRSHQSLDSGFTELGSMRSWRRWRAIQGMNEAYAIT